MLNATELQDLTGLLRLTWRKRNGESDEGMVEHCLKTGTYIKIDNMFVDVCAAKPSIVTTIWYDDEKADPGESFEMFKYANKHNMPHLFELESHFCGVKPLFFIAHYYNDKTGGRLVSLVYDDEPSKLPIIRKVTAPELKTINAAIHEVQADYEKRLVNYFKRYGQHVTSRGYWVNR